MEWSRTNPIIDALNRRAPRRHWWSRVVDWLADARSHRVICLVAGIWILNAFDLALTLLSHEQGMLQEQNPVARHMLSNGVASIILYKTGLVCIGSYPILRFRRARITELGAIVVLIAYATLAVRWSACYDIYAESISSSSHLADVQPITGAASALSP